MRGSDVKLLPTGGVITLAKNTSVLRFSTPSAAPVDFTKLRMRPLTATMNCVGPTAPIESGGKAFVSASVAPVKLIDESVCAALGPPARASALVSAGSDATSGAPGALGLLA